MKHTDPRDHAKLSAERRQAEALKRNSIAARIEAPNIPVYNSHKRIRVAKVG